MKKEFYSLEETKKMFDMDNLEVKNLKEELKNETYIISEIPLSEIRKAQNLTQAELAEKVGLSQTDISKIEKGKKRITISRLQELANGMGMDVHITFVPR
ncbi:helix-turn-helix domain-containing protein [Parasphaerochaeta coccoides]|uniref:Helix-turn-helix domain protein n=1 Tax=Parasphaerochaeta coccoides (strain ATCC BAA-1237 / DSM 17374 / SPN1) TaxID=760011 RepID=F4GKM8_PARC1|nr:helix-turn-helix transcriptional regulator [Parasphaerochaeta coccoides]AEC01437.1 helix-turn-helix domain protein [Parasphaerochaeta coccoides DSM 17374]